MSPREFVQVYKSLLRLAKKFDRNPAAKCLIFRHTIPSPQSYTFQSASSVYFAEILETFLPDANFYFGSGPNTLVDMVRFQVNIISVNSLFSVFFPFFSAGEERV